MIPFNLEKISFSLINLYLWSTYLEQVTMLSIMDILKG